LRRSRGLGRWGAHSHWPGVEPLPARNLHGTKAGTQMSEARHALSAQHSTRRGVTLGLKQALKDSALTCWGARRPPPGWRRGEPVGKCGTKAGHGLTRRRALGLGLVAMTDPHSAGVRSLFSTGGRVGKGRRRHSPRVDVGVVTGSVQRIRDGEEEVRGVVVPALLLLPRDGVSVRLPPTAQPHLLLLPTRAPPLLSPSSSCGGGQGRGKPPVRPGLREGLGPGL
jgi:hypothetical protein